VPDAVLAGFLRVVTNRRIFREPFDGTEAWAAVDALLAAPATLLLRPGERHWDRFRGLCDEIDARGNDVQDAFLAAYAVEHGAGRRPQVLGRSSGPI
jgi:toxin-antitoxin system PIN domain toxin